MTIKSRFLIATTLILLIAGFFSWLSVRVITENIVTNWVSLYAEKQLRYDEVRTLLPLTHELNAAKEFASLDAIVAWAKAPNNDSLKTAALEEAEHFRHRFSDNAFFIALAGNNQYYYCDDDKKASNNTPLNYTLDKNKVSDAWFYSLIDSPLDYYLNINPDTNLGVVKLWSDVVIRDENGNAIAAVGSGVDLSTFLSDIVSKQDINSAITFTNGEGAIQLYQQEELIDYATITKQNADKQLIFQLLDDDESKAKLQQGLDAAKSTPDKIEAIMVNKDGFRQLASIIYIPEINWFQINFIEIDRFLPWTEFSGFLAVLFISLICTLAIVYVLITFIVIRPLKALSISIRSLEKNDYRAPQASRFSGLEIQRLTQHYQKMSNTLLEYQHKLETKVAKRTEELNKLATLDPLTQLYNRRGFEIHLKHYMDNWQNQQQEFCVISVDMNGFKSVNDQYGHATGDQLLQNIAHHLTNIVEKKGEVARWGGDEFLILTKCYGNKEPEKILNQLQRDSAALVLTVNDVKMTTAFSVGHTHVMEGDSIENILSRADKAMYQEKFSNRTS